jgi:hypothetical protein
MKVLIFVALFALLTPGLSWWCTGHMLVANVAIKSMCQKAADASNSLIGLQSKFYPQSPDFVQTACWADDIKSTSGFYETWHYINYPYIPNDPPMNTVTSVNAENNVVWALTQINSSFYKSNPNQLELSRALYFHIHFMGDIHQPLHAITLYSHTHEPPSGDAGGNLYGIKGANVTTLHKFWDSGAGLWDTDYSRPLNTSSYTVISDLTAGIMTKYPKSIFGDLLGMPYDTYARESCAYAVNVTYTTPENGNVSDAYVAISRQVCERSVALGGYRLAYTLEKIFGC